MSEIFNKEVLNQLKQGLNKIKNPIKIITFIESGKPLCDEVVTMMMQLAALNNKIKFVEYDLIKNADLAEKYGIDKVPGTTILASDKPTGIKFYGIPSGHEINSLLFAVLESSGIVTPLDAKLVDAIKQINKKINIKVFVSLQCPHCPKAVMTACKIALLNKNIDAEMIQTNLYSDLANKFKINSVPRIIFNDSDDLLGVQPIEMFVDKLKKL
ncbi:protein disulfide oxidoreductase [Psychrilyobacter atlanticus]|uniref:protein disulfide oxidoreductase n=1 Tax=Psychrilyobacter atlanticus TaxID=271091 RepID=UPI0003F4F320|nr:thioredoxin family protein [Psychrilyobacter atlanticus]